MSTITKERAQKIIEAADEVITALAGTNEDVHSEDSRKMCDLWDDLNDRYAPPEVVRELARIALASLEAEPVGYVDAEYSELLKQGHIESCSVYAESGEGCLPFYTASPAPLAVPDRSMFEKWWESEHGSPLDSWDSLRTTEGYCDDGIDGQFEAWNACRAAMLNQEKING